MGSSGISIWKRAACSEIIRIFFSFGTELWFPTNSKEMLIEPGFSGYFWRGFTLQFLAVGGGRSFKISRRGRKVLTRHLPWKISYAVTKKSQKADFGSLEGMPPPGILLCWPRILAKLANETWVIVMLVGALKLMIWENVIKSLSPGKVRMS